MTDEERKQFINEYCRNVGNIKIKCDDCKFVEDCVDYGWEGCKKFTPTQKKRHTQETTELKPCPFCGGEAEVWVSDVTDRAIVYCTVCDAQIRIRQNEQEAIEAWNKRVPCDTCAMYYPDDGCMAGLTEGEVTK